MLFLRTIITYVLDDDNVRHGINSNLGFNREDRKENLRRIAEFSKLFDDAGLLVLAAFTSSYEQDREYIRKRFECYNCLERYVKCSLEKCEQRDPKRQYKKARSGIIKNYTVISAPYEERKNPHLVIDIEKLSLQESACAALDYINKVDLIWVKKTRVLGLYVQS